MERFIYKLYIIYTMENKNNIKYNKIGGKENDRNKT